MFNISIKYSVIIGVLFVWCIYVFFINDYNINTYVINTRTYNEKFQHHASNENDIKYILLWTRRKCYECAPFYYMTEGSELFSRRYCPKQNCYITENRTLLGDYTNFDAILFNGRPILRMKNDTFPTDRSPHQWYVFVQLESSDRFPVCDSKFDNYFNGTMTYRLDSDHPWPYVEIALKNGTIAGPRIDMDWSNYEDTHPISEELREKIRNKRKAAAWFVSNCGTRSGRERFVKNLQKELIK